MAYDAHLGIDVDQVIITIKYIGLYVHD